MGVTAATEQGPRRYQEDRFFYKVIPLQDSFGWFLAVMDGHGGPQAADVCLEWLTQTFPEAGLDTDAKTSLRNIVADLARHTRMNESGTTLSIACVFEESDEVVIAVLGDSPVIVIDEADTIHISPVHNVKVNIEERRAAIRRGGTYRAGYILNSPDSESRGIELSRALGDADFGDILSREPDISTIKKPRWVLVGTDGLFNFDYLYTDAFEDAVWKLRKDDVTARGIVDLAMARELEDNATAVLWKPAAFHAQ